MYPFFVSHLSEDGHTVAETCRRHKVCITYPQTLMCICWFWYHVYEEELLYATALQTRRKGAINVTLSRTIDLIQYRGQNITPKVLLSRLISYTDKRFRTHHEDSNVTAIHDQTLCIFRSSTQKKNGTKMGQRVYVIYLLAGLAQALCWRTSFIGCSRVLFLILACTPSSPSATWQCAFPCWYGSTSHGPQTHYNVQISKLARTFMSGVKKKSRLRWVKTNTSQNAGRRH